VILSNSKKKDKGCIKCSIDFYDSDESLWLVNSKN
jgi:hypothetical protein